MIFPRFNPKSFWSYEGACELFGARYPAAPLGMITLAALLPRSWDIRLVNRNTEELTEAQLDWADLVMTGGMLAQQFDTLRVIEIARAASKPHAGATIRYVEGHRDRAGREQAGRGRRPRSDLEPANLCRR
jgi:hypothetical protein